MYVPEWVRRGSSGRPLWTQRPWSGVPWSQTRTWTRKSERGSCSTRWRVRECGLWRWAEGSRFERSRLRSCALSSATPSPRSLPPRTSRRPSSSALFSSSPCLSFSEREREGICRVGSWKLWEKEWRWWCIYTGVAWGTEAASFLFSYWVRRLTFPFSHRHKTFRRRRFCST